MPVDPADSKAVNYLETHGPSPIDEIPSRTSENVRQLAAEYNYLQQCIDTLETHAD